MNIVQMLKLIILILSTLFSYKRDLVWITIVEHGISKMMMMILIVLFPLIGKKNSIYWKILWRKKLRFAGIWNENVLKVNIVVREMPNEMKRNVNSIQSNRRNSHSIWFNSISFEGQNQSKEHRREKLIRCLKLIEYRMPIIKLIELFISMNHQ